MRCARAASPAGVLSRISGRYWARHLRRPSEALAALELVGREQVRAAPAAQAAGELPREIDRIADAHVHAEAPGGDHQVRRVAGEEHAALAVAFGEQQVLLPLADVEHLVFERHADGLLELARHVLVALDDRVQGPVPRRVLHDEEARLAVGHVVVAALAGALAEGKPLEKLGAGVERLAQLEQVALAAQADAELVAHGARATVAADEISRPQGFHRAVFLPDPGANAGRVLLEGKELAAVAHRHARQGLGHGLEQRLEGVLRHELVGLERHRAVVAGVDLPPRRVHRRIRQVQQRRLVHREDYIDVHRHIRAQPGRADLCGEPHAAEDFHAAGVAALHLRKELRRELALDEGAAHALLPQVDGERQAHGPGAYDQDFGIRHQGQGIKVSFIV